MTLPTQQTIRGYELKERLGQGGFGAVYRAYQAAIDREVAVKVILPQYASQPDFVRRFEAEAQLIARLEHPHIVPLYDFWRDPQGAYLVMRYVRGGSLRGLLKTATPEIGPALKILREIASALDVAHRHQIIHRDVKPDNILLDEDGNAYLSDFGIAQMIKSSGENDNADSDDETLTGSLGYISPEQARGEALSARSDLYSLAVIAYEMIAGKHPFHGESPTTQMVKHLTENLPPVVVHRADLPAGVDDVIQRATFKNPAERYANAGEFIRALELACGIAPSASTASPLTIIPGLPLFVSNPYKGLRAFEESDAADFFGREKLVHTLVERMETPTIIAGMKSAIEMEPYRFLAVVGPSGSGKSSVVKAGVVPALRRGFLPGSANWIITSMTPGYNPMQQLEQELLTIASKNVENLGQILRASPDSLGKVLPKLLYSKSEVLLVIDQFEEVFTPLVSEEERTLFLESLQRAVNDPLSRLRVIITLRADFYDRPLAYAGFGKLLQRRTEVVLPLTPNELADAISNPAERVGVSMERGLALEIAAEVADQPGTLPLLQYALTELFERREANRMTRAAYQSLGGVMGALTRRAEEIYQALKPSEQQAAKMLFQRLVTLGEGTEDTRRRALRVEVDHLSPVMGKVIEAFGQARLISFDRDALTRTPTIEVAHEALIRQWKTLREWLNENRESIRMQQHLTQAAQAWVEGSRDPGDLYRGGRLSQLKEWAETHLSELNMLEREFLHASIAQEYEEAKAKEVQQQREMDTLRKLADSEKQRAEEQTQASAKLRARGRTLTLAFAASLVLLLTAIWLGYQANQQRQQAEAQRMEAEKQRGEAESQRMEAEKQRTEAEKQRSEAEAQRQNAQDSFQYSERLRLAAESTSLLLGGSDIEAAPLLSIASLNMGYSPEADSALQRAMTYTYPTFTLSDHSASIYAARFSPDGKVMATASTDSTAILWEVASGKAIRVLEGHESTAACLDFSPNGKLLATGSDDTTVRVWDVETGETLHILEGAEDVVWAVAFSPDGKHIASASYDKTLRIWDVATGAELANHPMVETASGMVYTPDGGNILTAGDDNIARLYNAETGAVVREFRGHTLAIITVDISPDGKYILTGSDDKTARIWDAQTGAEIMRLIGHQEGIYGANFSSDGRYVLTAGYDRIAILWDRETGVRIRQFVGHRSSLYGSDISPDDRWILTASFDGSARLWPSGLEPNPRAFTHTSSIISLAVSPDGKTLATGTSKGDAHLWDTTTGKERRLLLGHEYTIENLAFSPDGKKLVTASDDYTLAIWDTTSGEMLHQFTLVENTTWAVRFSPDNRSILTGSEEGLTRWDVETGEQLTLYDAENIYYTVGFSNDGKTVVGGGYNGLCFYNTETGEKIACPEEFADTSLYSMDFSPDGSLLAVGGRDIYLLEFPSLALVRTLKGHTGVAPSLRFSPDGKRIVSGSEDGSARIWDAVTGQTLRIITNRNALVNSVAFSTDGKRVYVGGADNMVWMLDLEVQDLISLACQTISHRLGEEERQKFRLAPETLTCP